MRLHDYTSSGEYNASDLMMSHKGKVKHVVVHVVAVVHYDDVDDNDDDGDDEEEEEEEDEE